MGEKKFLFYLFYLFQKIYFFFSFKIANLINSFCIKKQASNAKLPKKKDVHKMCVDNKVWLITDKELISTS